MLVAVEYGVWFEVMWNGESSHWDLLHYPNTNS